MCERPAFRGIRTEPATAGVACGSEQDNAKGEKPAPHRLSIYTSATATETGIASFHASRSVTNDPPAPCREAGAEGIAIRIKPRWRVGGPCQLHFSRPFRFILEAGSDECAHVRGEVFATHELERAVRLGDKASVRLKTEEGRQVFLSRTILALLEVAQRR